jgi:hypothetical protein
VIRPDSACRLDRGFSFDELIVPTKTIHCKPFDKYFFCRYINSMAKKRTGRPKVPAEQRKGRYLQVRVDDAERDAFAKAAAANGLDTSSWVRLRLREAARRDLKSVGAEMPFMTGQS